MQRRTSEPGSEQNCSNRSQGRANGAKISQLEKLCIKAGYLQSPSTIGHALVKKASAGSSSDWARSFRKKLQPCKWGSAASIVQRPSKWGHFLHIWKRKAIISSGPCNRGQIATVQQRKEQEIKSEQDPAVVYWLGLHPRHW